MSIDKNQQVLFTELLVPKGRTNRTGRKLDNILYITIHETDTNLYKAPSYKNREFYIEKIMNPVEGKERVGYHYLVSHNEIINFIPDNEYTRHTGNDYGNTVSIGIERLVNVNVDFEVAIFNQAKLTATLMEKHGIPIEAIVPHSFWRNVQCPARLLAGQNGGWRGFLLLVEKCYCMKDFFLMVLN